MTDVLDKPATSPISTRKHGDVLIVLSNNPPVNALSTPVRQGLVDAIAEAEADDAVRAVVIACEGQTFFAGADITEFGKPPQQPWLPVVVDTIENCSKPVVAAIHGTALGGGLMGICFDSELDPRDVSALAQRSKALSARMKAAE
jgi:3-hydroxyacyl-CoA dehydrogenase